MSVTQAAFPSNKHIAFIQLSKPSQLFENCWAEENERVIIIGLRKGKHAELRTALSSAAEKGEHAEEGCFGTKVACKLKAIIANEPSKIRSFLGELEANGIINSREKDAAVADLGVRGQRLHPLIPFVFDAVGAGI